MNFRFKLSRRLARIRGPFVLSLIALLASCGADQSLTDPIPSLEVAAASLTPVATVTITPGTAAGVVGDSGFYTAAVRDSLGNPLTGRTIRWSSTDTTIVRVNSSGLVRAIGAGTARVRARSGLKVGFAAITVSDSGFARPRKVTDLAAGAATESTVTLSFTEVRDGAGRPARYDIRATPAPMAWGSASSVLQGTCASPLTGTSAGTRRSCTVSGLSPSVAYEFQAVSYRTGLDGRAVFGPLSNVGQASTTGTVVVPPPDGGSWAHEPSGYTLIGDNPFDQLTAGGWDLVWNDRGLGSIVTDAAAPQSPSSVLELRYSVGFNGGVGPASMWHPLPNLTRMYVGFWWKASNPWQGHQSNVNKIAFVDPATGGDIYMAMYGPPGGPYQLRVIPQFPGFASEWLLPNVNDTPVTVGTWHRIEWVMETGTGLVQWWMDGQLIGDHRGVPFPAGGMAVVKFNPTWGGAGDTKTENDYFRYDHVRVSGN